MQRTIGNRKDFWSGMMFTGFGVTFAALALDYDMGSLASMGPGWFPMVLGLLLAALGIAVALSSFRETAASQTDEDDDTPVGWRELSIVAVAIAVFALSLNTLGVVVAVAIMVLIAGWAAHDRKPLELVVIALSLSGLCYVIFVRGLGVPLQIWPAVLGG